MIEKEKERIKRREKKFKKAYWRERVRQKGDEWIESKLILAIF
jgi:hypothetical protein